MIQTSRGYILLVVFFGLMAFSSLSINGQEANINTDISRMPDGLEKLDEYLNLLRISASNRPDSALLIATEAMRLAEPLKDNRRKAEILFSQSISNSILGRRSEAVELANNALEALKFEEDPLYEARIISHLGTVYADMGDYSAGAELFDQALKISEQENDTLGIINGYLRLGVIQSFQGQEKEAIEFYDQSLEIARAANREVSIRTLLNNIGIAYAKQELYEQALAYFNEAEVMEREGQPNISYLTQLLGNIGQAYYHLKNYSKAQEYLSEVDSLINNNENSINPIVKVNNYVNFGKLYMALGRFPLAETYLQKALQIATNTNSLPGQQSSNEQLTELYKTTGEFEKALETSRIANELRDSIYNTEKFEIIENLKTRYEVEKKDAELALLKELNDNRTFQRNLLALLVVITTALFGFMFYNYSSKLRTNEELLTKQKELEEINRMKNKLFSIIGHDLRGPFQGILGGLFLIKDNAFNEEEKQEFIQKLIESGKATHEVLESLLIWGKAQSFESNPEKLNSKKLIADSIKPYKEAARQKNISIINNALEEFEVQADYKEIEFVLRNLINNAIKYTHPDGQISIKSQISGEKLKIDIIDNGVGIPSYRIPTIFNLDQIQSTTGTKNEVGSGLGLVVCHDLIQKNKGKIKVESELGHGSKFSIFLPLA